MIKIIGLGLTGALVFLVAVGSLNVFYHGEFGLKSYQRNLADEENEYLLKDKDRNALKDFFSPSEDESETSDSRIVPSDASLEEESAPIPPTPDTPNSNVVNPPLDDENSDQEETGADEPVVEAGPQRISGYPPAGASSFHLWWGGTGGDLFKEVSATVEVTKQPSVNELYFWALQVSFYDDDWQSTGGAHTGIQWHPDSSGTPFRTVNWGGYDNDGNVLSGSESSLPPKQNDPSDKNTRSYNWSSSRQYRLRVYKIENSSGTWRAEIRDMGTGATTVIRDLYGGGDWLGSPVVWSEVFAKCDDPSASVIWRDFKAIKSDGQSVTYNSASANYQHYNNGGCTNTNSQTTSGGIKQATNTTRTTQQGTTLSF